LKKSTIFLAFILFTGLLVKAQQTHFIYIQSEGKQAFYVRTKEKIISSSETGYLIIPRLEQGQLSFTLGFPKNAWSSSVYNVEIENKDLGYQLKKIDSLTWALYNIQTSELLAPAETGKASNQIIQTSTDEFANILAEVSNTPSVKQKKIKTDTTETIVAKVEAPVQTESKVPSVEPQNTQQAIDKPVVAVIETPDPVAVTIPAEPEKKSKKTKSKSEKSIVKQDFSFLDSTGRSLTYTIKDGDKEEHVVVFISYEKPLVFPQPEPDTLLTSALEKPAVSELVQATEKPVVRCPETAEEKDFLKLRRKMTQEDNEEKMIEVAEKAFKDKCYSTDQIRYLAVLFINEDNRLAFIKMSVSYVADPASFGSLQQLFNTEKNVDAFKAIIY